MVNKNSIDVYENLKSKGILSTLRLRVFKIICLHQPLTSYDCEKILEPRNYSSVAARITELKKMELIRVSGKIKQEGFWRDVYEITGSLEPKALKKKLSIKKKI